MEYLVLVESMSSEWHISQYVVFYWKTCLTGGHVLQLDNYCKRVCFAVQYVSHFTAGFALLETIYYMRTYLVGVQWTCFKETNDLLKDIS